MTTCYRPLQDSVLDFSNSDIPCSGADPTGCCAYGDFCMSDGICHYTRSTTEGSGYYLQSCSDSTFQSSICQETFHCTSLEHPDIVYNTTIGLWACCSSDTTTGVHCSTAANETWAAPAPDALANIASLEQAPATSSTPLSTSSTSSPPPSTPSSILSGSTPLVSPFNSPPSVASSSPSSSIPTFSPTSSSSTIFSPTSSTIAASTISPSRSSTATTATTAAAAASTPTNSSPSSASIHKTGLSAATSAGIGVGVTLCIIALIALIFFAAKHMRKRKRSRQTSAVLFGGPDPTSEIVYKEHNAELVSGAGAAAGVDYGYKQHRFTGEPRFLQDPPMAQTRYGPGRHQPGDGYGVR